MANHATKAKFPTACNKSYGIPEIKYAGMISIEMECRALNETIQSNKKAEKKANEAKIFMLILFSEIIFLKELKILALELHLQSFLLDR